jgi:cytochrome c553
MTPTRALHPCGNTGCKREQIAIWAIRLLAQWGGLSVIAAKGPGSPQRLLLWDVKPFADRQVVCQGCSDTNWAPSCSGCHGTGVRPK